MKGEHCDHETLTGFCFPCWQAEREKRFTTLQTELGRLLSAGVTILETWPGGRMTAWRWINTTDPKTCRITAEPLSGVTVGEHDAFVPGLTAEYLADHLTNRSKGFGTAVTAFCCDCGDNVVQIPTDADPVCAKCLERRQDIEPPDAADLGEL